MKILKYGLKDGELVHINSVSNGLTCNCNCPSCGGPLVANKGNKKQHHFKHYKVADCNHGAESALHLMAKNIVANTKIVYIPNAPHNIYDWNPAGKCYKFDSAYIEEKVSPDLRCDVLLEHGSIRLNVEIKVTHEVDTIKKIKVFNENLRTIEIDLSGIDTDYTEEKIRTIIESGKHTKLLYSPKAKAIYAKWLLGEWRKVFRDRTGHCYIKNSRCAKQGEATYFNAYDAYNTHCSCECHECYGIEECNYEYFLCRGQYGNCNFEEIDKIIAITRENDIVKYAELIVNGKTLIFKNKR